MNPLSLDFVQRRRLGSFAGWLIFLTGVAAAVVVGLDYVEARDTLGRAEARQARLVKLTKSAPNTRQVGITAAATPAIGASESGKVVAVALTQLQLPWDSLLRELEGRVDPAVALLSIEAQGQGQNLRLSAEAKNMTDVVAYIGHLRQSTVVTSATLSGHEEKQVGPVKVIRFHVDVKWQVRS